jgi:hypothetical protein
VVAREVKRYTVQQMFELGGNAGGVWAFGSLIAIANDIPLQNDEDVSNTTEHSIRKGQTMAKKQKQLVGLEHLSERYLPLL